MPDIPPELVELADQLGNGKPPKEETVRTFLGWFNAQRRGISIVQNIREALAELKLKTEPDFESAYIDSNINFVLAPDKEVAEGVSRTSSVPATTTEEIDSSASLQTAFVGGAVADPTYRISKLASANKSPAYVKPDDTLQKATTGFAQKLQSATRGGILFRTNLPFLVSDPDFLCKAATTLMLNHNLSQLPVMQNERRVEGVVSWHSIGVRLSLGCCSSDAAVRECMDPPEEISADASLFDVIPSIVKHQYVLVRDVHNRISGIVTTSDLSQQFGQLGEPFLLIGEIENHIRRLIVGKFRPDELAANRDPADESRRVEKVEDLTFGEYEKLLENKDHWSRLDLAIDRKIFIDRLGEVRRIRNDAMHFDPDGLPDSDLAVLRQFTRFLQTLQKVGAVA